MELFYGLIYLIGCCLGAFTAFPLWIAYIYRSPLAGFLIGLAMALAIVLSIDKAPYQSSTISIALALIIDGLLLGWLGKKFRKPKKELTSL